MPCRIEFTIIGMTVTDWSFTFRCSPPHLAVTQLLQVTAQSTFGLDRTFTFLFHNPHRRPSHSLAAIDFFMKNGERSRKGARAGCLEIRLESGICQFRLQRQGREKCKRSNRRKKSDS